MSIKNVIVIIILVQSDAFNWEYYYGERYAENNKKAQDTELIESVEEINNVSHVENFEMYERTASLRESNNSEEKYEVAEDMEPSNGRRVTRTTLKDSIVLSLYDDYYNLDDLNAPSSSINLQSTRIPLGNINNTESHNFFNLKPKVIELPMNMSVPEIGDNMLVWYIPERSNCFFDMPLVFGFKNYDFNGDGVFRLHNVGLKNVRLHERSEGLTRKKPYSGTPYVSNKWCNILPCYGDHTLCLFPDKKMSAICKKDYRVRTPLSHEQTLLVKTVNSMRNRVARGKSNHYKHLPTAANMKQMRYDLDLEEMAAAWLRQCSPGPAPCVSLDTEYVTQLECSKIANKCCSEDSNDFDADW